MESFHIQIADLVTEVQPLYETTRIYCSNYLTHQPAAFHVTITDEDLTFEQYMLDIEAKEEGMKLRKFTPPFLERAAIQRKIAERLLQENTILLHGSTVAVDGAAYLFTAACGTGKSTHTRLWREVFGDRAVMVNDDKPFLKILGDRVIAYGSPWSGKHGLDANISAPLKGICILHRGAENEIHRLKPEEAATMLHHQSFDLEKPLLREKTANLVDHLLQIVPLWEMYCTKEPDAAKVSFQAMSENHLEKNRS